MLGRRSNGSDDLVADVGRRAMLKARAGLGTGNQTVGRAKAFNRSGLKGWVSGRTVVRQLYALSGLLGTPV